MFNIIIYDNNQIKKENKYNYKNIMLIKNKYWNININKYLLKKYLIIKKEGLDWMKAIKISKPIPLFDQNSPNVSIYLNIHL